VYRYSRSSYRLSVKHVIWTCVRKEGPDEDPDLDSSRCHRTWRASRCLTCQQAAYVDAHEGSHALAGSSDPVASVGLYEGCWRGSEPAELARVAATCRQLMVHGTMKVQWSYLVLVV